MAFPLEIWQLIYAFLSPFDLLRILQLSKTAGDTLTRQQLNDVSTWTAIFKNEEWFDKVSADGLRPLLIGSDLRDSLYRSATQRYIALVIGNSARGASVAQLYPETLLTSLRTKAFCVRDLEVECNRFTLNIAGIFEPLDPISVPDPSRLCISENGQQYTHVTAGDSAGCVKIPVLIATKDAMIVELPDLLFFSRTTQIDRILRSHYDDGEGIDRDPSMSSVMIQRSPGI